MIRMKPKSNARARAQQRFRREERARRRPPSFAARRSALVVMITAAFLAVGAGAVYRQVVEVDFLRDQGEKRYLRDREIAARRGMITDRFGQPLAVSTAVETIWCDPRLLTGRDDALPALARALEMPLPELREKLVTAERNNKHFLYLRRRTEPHITAAVEEAIDSFKLQGIGIDTEYRRFYPGGEMLGHIVGYTNIDDTGQEGMELIYDKVLAARPGLRRVIQDGRGRVVEEVEQVRAPHHGQDLALSIDRRLQFLAYRELLRTVTENKAVSGSAVVLDARTGEVLAMVNQPSFNPNKPRTEPADTRRNRALTDVFEPGSTVKPFVVVAGLEAGVITPRTPIATGGSYAVGGHVVKDVHSYSGLDVTGVVTKSSNIGVVKIAQKMERARLWTLYDGLGFGRPTGVGFPGERTGYLSHYKRWSAFEHATLAFGYGLNLTALQLAQAYSVLAADGVRRPPTLLRREAVPPGESIFSADTARKVRVMMETVVSDQGTARRAKITGYKVAGKTGTAKKSAGRRGYAAGKYQAVFAGMAPATNPRFVMVVMIDEPRGNAYYGGLVAAPMFAKVMETALRLYNVPPDDADRSLLLASLREEQGKAAAPEKGKR